MEDSESSSVPYVVPADRPISECGAEVADDILAIGKKICDFLLERDKNRRGSASKEKLVGVISMLEKKIEEMKYIVEISNQYRERNELISQLQKCVENRDAIISRHVERMREYEGQVTKVIFEGNQKLKRMAEADANPLYSEEIIKFAHQISKGWSVSAPEWWQIGDPMRPFPTENELRQSTISAPRPPVAAAVPSGGTGAMGGPLGAGTSRSPAVRGGAVASPGQLGWSPRTSLSATSASPRGRGTTPSGSSAGGGTPWRGTEASPFGRGAGGMRNVTPAAPAPLATPGQMSSGDSSSSSSSDDDN